MSARRILSHVFGLGCVTAIVVALVYISRFWIWRAPWGREGLFEQAWLAPAGDIVRRQLRGTPFADNDILIWGGGSILVLTLLAAIASRLSAQK